MDDFFFQPTPLFFKRDSPDHELLSFSSPYKIQEDNNQYSVSIDVPGATKEDLNITVQSNTLHIQGSRKSTTNEETKSSSFNYSLKLDKNVDLENFNANLVDGVLSLTAPKKTPQVRVIEVASGTDNSQLQATTTNVCDEMEEK